MQALHIVLVVATALAFVAAAAPGSRVGSGGQHGRLIALVVSGAAVVGNAASLMPGRPGWYARAMIVLTLGVLAWALVRLAGRGRRDAVAVVRREPRVIVAAPVRRVAPTAPPAPGAGRSHLYALPGAEVVDAEIVNAEVMQDAVAAPPARTGSAMRLATQETFEEYGPARGRHARGQAYVAARLGDYLPASKQHLARRRSRARTVGEGDLRTRLNRAYGLDAAPRGTLTSHQV